MKKTLPATLRDTVVVVAEVIAEGMPLRRLNRVELEVRLTGKELRVGPARLVGKHDLMREINILGVYFYDGRPPEAIDPFVLWIGVEGITPADIEPGQRIVQAQG